MDLIREARIVTDPFRLVVTDPFRCRPLGSEVSKLDVEIVILLTLKASDEGLLITSSMK